MSENTPYLSVFISYNADHVPHIRNIVIPALAAQTCPMPISLHLVNYGAAESAFTTADGVSNITVTDHTVNKDKDRYGFGECMNFLFREVSPQPYFLILNPDTIPDHCALAVLIERFESGKTGIVEARQWPSEHPKEYDEVTGFTPWASGACALIASDMFMEVGGFDPIYFMYCEDVDLSWRSWLTGREVIYAPLAGVMHFTGLLHYRKDRLYFEHFYSARNFIIIAYKFFGETGEKKALDLLATTGYSPGFIDTVNNDYYRVRPNIKLLTTPTEHPMVKITGFNSYHLLQAERRMQPHD